LLILATAFLCIAPTASWADLAPYSQDFEDLDQAASDALAGDGWKVFGNVFGPDWSYWYGYGPFPAPNGGPGFSGIDIGQGGPDQGDQQLVVYSDYNNSLHGIGAFIEANVFQEQTIGAADIGSTWVFEFDSKRGNIAGGTTAKAFFKTLDPSNNFALTNFISIDMTDVPVTWGTYLLTIVIDPSLENQILQFGFLNTATYYEGSGIFYDNVSFREATRQCHQVSAVVPSELGTVEVCSKSEADDLAAGETESVCVEKNQDEAQCGGVCSGDACQCIVENFWSPRNNYNFRKVCSKAPVMGCAGDVGYVCDYSSVTYTCPCVCRTAGDPGGYNEPGCLP
jgi:hypothetical protein